MQLKPQDLLVAFKLVSWADRRWTYAQLAHDLGLSGSETHACVKRGVQAGLLIHVPAGNAPVSPAVLEEPAAIYRVRARLHRARTATSAVGMVRDGSNVHDNPARVHAQNLAEFAVHGARYAFPPQRLPNALGVPTGCSVPAVAAALGKGKGRGEMEVDWVWPHIHGEVPGQGLEPLHPSVPYAAMQDAALYEMLALLDLLRLGSTASDRRGASLRLLGCILAEAGERSQGAAGV